MCIYIISDLFSVIGCGLLWYFGTLSIEFIFRHFKSQMYITVLFIFQMFGGNLLNRQVVKTTPKSLNGSASGTHSAMVVEFVMQMVGAASNMFYFDKHWLKWVAQFHLQDHVFPNQQSRCLSLPLLSSETSHQPGYNMIQQPCLKVYKSLANSSFGGLILRSKSALEKLMYIEILHTPTIRL